jgi:D-beta-D-heptose 7-phosphate kinase/D-beta-D-heptose 1-phosphate adenosyltransferase
MNTLDRRHVAAFLERARRLRILVVGDVMLDQFIWGRVTRISPEAPVPVVEWLRESSMPGGAANVARNLSALGVQVELFGVTGRDPAGEQLLGLLKADRVDCRHWLTQAGRTTTCKTRIIAHQQQVARVDRESPGDLEPEAVEHLLGGIRRRLSGASAVIVGDYGKGVVTQGLLDELKRHCRERGVWLSLDPKPVRHLDLRGLSLITPNRKEAFELAGLADARRGDGPLADAALGGAVNRLMESLAPALLLITLGDQGMLLCRRGQPPYHIPTVAREVFDVSGAGDTVIASFTLAIAAGGSPVEAAVFSNHAAGVVVGKIGTAIVTPAELLASFRRPG